MKTDWERWSKTAGWEVHGDEILVELPDGRRHRVRVNALPEVLELSAVVVRGKRAAAIEGVAHRIWTRNRHAQRIGFRIDHHGRVVGESWLPRPGLTADEFRAGVKHVAAECDRLEALLVGEDFE